MICLGCGMDCKCSEPASFVTWPLEAAVSREGLQYIAQAISFFNSEPVEWDNIPESAQAELLNVYNNIKGHLERDEPIVIETYRPPQCPTPQKRRYHVKDHTRRDAMKFHMHPYQCECGYWHLSKLAPGQFADKVNAPGASADEFPAIDPMLL